MQLNKEQLLLVQLGEEGAEIAQAVSKALRFGLEDDYKDGPTNKQKLTQEVADLIAVFNKLVMLGILDDITHNQLLAKYDKIDKYLEYSKNIGVLNNEQKEENH